MLSDKTYKKILDYLDDKYWDRKVDKTNWNYYGLNLDVYFENSILSIEYLNIHDFFEQNGGFVFIEEELLSNQYGSILKEERLIILQNIFNIIKYSSVSREENMHVIKVVTNVLKRENIKLINPENADIIVKEDNILDSGSYCNILKLEGNTLKKELKDIYKNDEKLQKRMKYEFDNMEKLRDCPYILNVYSYNLEESSYLMEKADMNLAKYLKNEIEISFDDKLHIIKNILDGMAYAHKESIIHRDLHLGNVLKIGGDFVICDFGLSKDLSIIRSLKTSYTEKNNHLFVDPVAISDFRKLDKKSDIYSLGKMIDYIFNYNSIDEDHILKTVVERCICRDKNLRYNSVDQIISDIDVALKSQNSIENKQSIINRILNNSYDSQIHDFILDLVNTESLSQFIVKHKLYQFWKIFIRFETVYQKKIIDLIYNSFSEATGYRGWSNYDVFTEISYQLCLESVDCEIKEIAKNILQECAEIRFEAKNLLKKISI